jgi:RNA polymerase sigma factor (sigma-70 family)
VVRHDVDPQPPPLTSPHAGDASDATLVAVAQRDHEAFAALYERYADPVLNYCYHRLGTWSEAEDAAQQVFLHAYTALGRFRDREGSFRSWLFTVAHHEVANRRRGQRRHPTVPLTEADTLRDLAPTPEDHAIATDRQDRVRGYHTTETYKKAMRKRQVWVEPLFAEAKLWHGEPVSKLAECAEAMADKADATPLRAIVQRHQAATGSAHAERLLAD